MICRIAHEGSYPPIGDAGEDGGGMSSDMSVEQRKAQPLEDKMKNLIPILLQNTCDEAFRTKWSAYPLVYHADKNLFYLETGAYF